MSADDELDRLVELRRKEMVEADAAAEAFQQWRLDQHRELEQFAAAFLQDMRRRGVRPPARGHMNVVTQVEDSDPAPPERPRGLLSRLIGEGGQSPTREPRSHVRSVDVQGWMVAAAHLPQGWDRQPVAGVPAHDAATVYVALLLADSGDWFVCRCIPSGGEPDEEPECELYPAQFGIGRDRPGAPTLVMWFSEDPEDRNDRVLQHMYAWVRDPNAVRASLASIAAASRGE